MTDTIDIDEDIIRSAADMLSAARDRGELIATAESCTAGLLAATLTAVPGCSDVFERGFVTYSNLSKSEMLGVPTLLRFTSIFSQVNAGLGVARPRLGLQPGQ